VIVGKLDGKLAVITGGSSGMALAGAKLFVDEGAHVFISGRRQEALDEAVKLNARGTLRGRTFGAFMRPMCGPVGNAAGLAHISDG
jgi:NAD(P)-dependent dehydrogenase (short-subunit alcohol dehydrogenase family)